MTALQKGHMLRCAASFVVSMCAKSTSHSSCFARLASGTFCKAVYIIKRWDENFLRTCVLINPLERIRERLYVIFI